MNFGPGQTQKGVDQPGLDDRSVEELKVKAIAAKERAYCRLSSKSILVHICNAYRFHEFDYSIPSVQAKSMEPPRPQAMP